MPLSPSAKTLRSADKPLKFCEIFPNPLTTDPCFRHRLQPLSAPILLILSQISTTYTHLFRFWISSILTRVLWLGVEQLLCKNNDLQCASTVLSNTLESLENFLYSVINGLAGGSTVLSNTLESLSNLLYSVINGLRTTVTVFSNSMNSLEIFSLVKSMTYSVLFMWWVKSKLLNLLRNRSFCSFVCFQRVRERTSGCVVSFEWGQPKV